MARRLRWTTAGLLVSIACGVLGANCANVRVTPGGTSGTGDGAFIGTNLISPDYWETNLPFSDVMKSAGSWFGSPSRAVFLHGVRDGRFPAGDYTVSFEGTGRLKIGSTWFPNPPWAGGNNSVYSVSNPTADGQILEIAESDPGDPVHEVSVRLPGVASGVFNPAYLDSLEGNRMLRFMDWQRTNDSQPYAWSARPRVEDDRWNGPSGVPLEIMLALAEALGAIPWFCIPHWADDAWVAAFADVVAQSGVDEVIVEYTNEHWNPIFGQHAYMQERAASWNVNVGQRPKGSVWYADRSTRICNLFRQRLGGDVSCVLSGQGANLDVLESQLWWLETTGQPLPNAIGINAYVGGDTPRNTNLDGVFSHIFNEGLPIAVERIATHANLADEKQIALWAYEGGQHLVPFQIPHVFEDAQRDPRMGQVYDQLLDAWEAAGGGLFAHFSGTGGWGVFGFWGERAYLGDVNPKFEALEARR